MRGVADTKNIAYRWIVNAAGIPSTVKAVLQHPYNFISLTPRE
jgi:hypothetical protein